MARAIERIEQDIALLEEAVGAIASELHSSYTNYLTKLGQAVRQQLILATFHLCTQGYPEAFLDLSVSQRQKLQQAVQKLSQQAAIQLLAIVNPISVELETDVAEDADNDAFINEEEARETLFSALEVDSEAETEESLEVGKLSNPIAVLKWQQTVEQAISQILKMLSHDTNLLLQKFEILPKNLPKPLLEVAAASSEVLTGTIPGPPNLLNLVIEVDSEEKSEDSSATQLIAINLRLIEIEFADTTLSSDRNHIRSLLAQLTKLARDYQHKQRERATAAAELAWRASWFEEQ